MKREKNQEKNEKVIWKDESLLNLKWVRELDAYDRIFFESMILIDPGACIIFFYYITGITLNIPLVYLIMDILIVMWWSVTETKHKREIEALEQEGDRMVIIRRKIEELKEIEREMREQREKEEQEKQKKQLRKSKNH